MIETSPSDSNPAFEPAAVPAPHTPQDPELYRMTAESLGMTYEDWGKGMVTDIRAMMRRHPKSHSPNLLALLNTTHAEEPAATRTEWLQGAVTPTAEEFEQLGRRRFADPVLSSVLVDRDGLAELAQEEPGRKELAHWLHDLVIQHPVLSQIDTIELRLFNDTTELAIGETYPNPDNKESSKWVIRTGTYTDKEFERLQDKLDNLAGLVPTTHCIRRGDETLILTQYLTGTQPTKEECAAFTAELTEQGFPAGLFDPHQENFIKVGGRMVYVDRDYLEV